jgi:hypothetical protein
MIGMRMRKQNRVNTFYLGSQRLVAKVGRCIDQHSAVAIFDMD